MSDNPYNLPTSPAPLPEPNAPLSTPVPGKNLSIVALILPFLCCWPVGMVLAIVGFVQGKGHRRGVAVAALIVNSFFALLSVIGMLLAPSESGSSYSSAFDDVDSAVVAPARTTLTKANAQSIADALEKEVDEDK